MARGVCSSVLLALMMCLLLSAPRNSIANTPQPPAAPEWDPACYRNNDQVQAFLQGIAASYPQLATLMDAGLSWEGTRHLWLLKLTNVARSISGSEKPAIFLLAGQRPRDIAGPEMLMRYISYLTQGYGSDADITWLIDNRELYILPVANPDGYRQVYANGASWYKNTDNDDGCSNPLQWGIDLNRNYPFHWNEVGVSGDPCDLSYRGPSALSEPESQHILAALQASGADMVVSLQAPGTTILYPWGWTSQAPAEAAGLDALGWNLGRLNGTQRQSVRTHNADTPVSGILDDTVYGLYGVPAYTLNIGSTLSPQCATLGPMFEAQRPAFLYATKAVGTTMGATLTHAYGPTPRNLAISAGLAPESIQVTGVLSSNYGVVMGAVYSIDNPEGDGGGAAMSGNFGGGLANVSATVDTSALSDGRHLLFVQGKNDANQWGVLSSAFFTVTGSFVTPSPTSQLTPTPNASSTPSTTRTATSSSTPTPSATSTGTPTAITTPTLTTTPLSGTNTATGTPYTPSVTPSRTPTFTRTETPTRTPTVTRTHTSTRTPTNTRTSTATPSETGTPTSTRTPTDTRTATSTTRTATSTRTPTLTYTPTSTRTSTATRTMTGSATPTRSHTSTRTPQPPPTATPLPCADYSDVYPSHFFYRAVDWLTCRQIVSGYSDNTFRPFNPATRAQILKMVVLGEEWELYDPGQPTFYDVLPEDWFYLYVETAFQHGAIGGYQDGTFRPNNNVTRAQLSKIIVSARAWPLLDPIEPHFTDVPPDNIFYTYVETAQSRGVVGGYGDGTFRPDNEATRGQLAKMLYVALNQ